VEAGTLSSDECLAIHRRAELLVLLRAKQCAVWNLCDLMAALERNEEAYFENLQLDRGTVGTVARDHLAFQISRRRLQADLDQAELERTRAQRLIDEWDRQKR
jgi:hypothetical protein